MTEDNDSSTIEVELSTNGKFAMESARNSHPEASDSAIINDALTSTWDLDGRKDHSQREQEDRLSKAEQREAERKREQLSSFL